MRIVKALDAKTLQELAAAMFEQLSSELDANAECEQGESKTEFGTAEYKGVFRLELTKKVYP